MWDTSEVTFVGVVGFILGLLAAAAMTAALFSTDFEDGACSAISGEYDSSQGMCVVDDKLVELPGDEE